MGTRLADRLPFILTALAFGAAVGAVLTRAAGLEGLAPPVDLWVAGTAVLGAALAHASAKRRARRLAAAEAGPAAGAGNPRPVITPPPRRSLWPAIRGAFTVVGIVTTVSLVVFVIGGLLLAPQVRKLFGASATGLPGETIAEARADQTRVHGFDGSGTLKTFATKPVAHGR